MGFSFKKMFSGSGWKKFKKVVGGVAKVATSFIPGVGGVVGGIAGKLIGAKKVASLGGIIDKVGKLDKMTNISKGFRSTAQVLKASPVMPGGAVSTPNGMLPPWSIIPPAEYGGGTRAPARRKKRKKAATRSSVRRSVTTRKKARTTKGRLPKFGSPAWRKRFKLDSKRRKPKKRRS